LSVALGRGTNNIGELYAIGMALERVSSEALVGTIKPGTQVAVLTDSEYTLGVVSGTMAPKTNQELINWVKGKLAFVRNTNPVELHWVPGHNGVEGNEKADKLAQDAALRSMAGKQEVRWPGCPRKAEPRRKKGVPKGDQAQEHAAPSLLSTLLDGNRIDDPVEEKKPRLRVLGPRKVSVNPRLSAPLLEICKQNSPMLRKVPRRALPVFAKTWSTLLSDAVYSGSESAWVAFFKFPKAVLLSPARGGRRISSKLNFADLVIARLEAWEKKERQDELWAAVLKRAGNQKAPKPGKAPQPDAVEKKAVSFLRMGDTKKALQSLVAAPIAPKSEETFKRLQELHPPGPPPLSAPQAPTPKFDAATVRTALASFGAGSAAGLFGYAPFLLQQCMRAETDSFSRALTAAVSLLASGQAPGFLRPFLAGGVSIALDKGGGLSDHCAAGTRRGDW
jgi:ribonuclease HI